MKNIKLIIDQKIVDIETNINISLNKAITDFNDLTARKGQFSYSFKLPITPNNNKIFKHISNIDVTNKFKKTNDYSAFLYVDDNLIFEGIFVLQNIDKKYYNGNLNVSSLNILNLIGEKTLRELKLPEIEFEGVQFIIESGIDTNAYTTGSDYMLNKYLGFDMISLLNAKKVEHIGLLGSSKDYSDYYSTGLINYYNQYIPNSESTNKLIPNFSIFDFMPRIRIVKVLEQIFKDLGFNLNIENSFLNDPDILIPFTDNSNDPKFNWGHLASLHVQSDNTKYGKALSSNQNRLFWENIGKPVIFSDKIFENIYYPVSGDTLGLNLTNITKNQTYFQDKIFTNNHISYSFNANDFILQIKNHPKSIENNSKVIHYLPTNKLNKDPLNNFNISKNPDSNGWQYIAPSSGEYEFEIEMFHDLRVYNTNPNDYMKNYVNYNDINYEACERFYTQNMVMFYKGDDTDIFNSYEQTIKSSQQNQFVHRSKNMKLMTNFSDQNIIAFYNPMFRDMHRNQTPLSIEEYFQTKGNILKEINTYPLTNDDRVNYMGFNLDTTILNYENNIVSNWNPTLEKTKKIVKLNNTGYTGYCQGMDPNFPYYNYHRKTFTITEKGAKGIVKFKFKTKLKQGDKVKMYYLTHNMMNDLSLTNFDFNYNNLSYLPGEPYHDFNKDFVYIELAGTSDDRYVKTNPYADLYTDDINVNSYKVNILNESKNLKLAEFLPNIKQKDFLIDYIKTNNIYFDIKDNTVTFKSKNDFYSSNKSQDLTKLISNDDYTIEPNILYEKTNFGYNYSNTDDLRESIASSNPIETFKYENNIYTLKETLDNTSKLFYSSESKEFIYYKNSDVNNLNSITQKIQLLNFTEDNKINNLQKDINNEANFNTSNRIILKSENYLYFDQNIKINDLNFISDNNSLYQATKINLPIKYHSNELIFNTLFNDRFLNLEDSSIVTYTIYLNSLEYAKIDLSKPVLIQNTLYYIQSVSEYPSTQNNLCKIKLIKI